MTAQPAPRREPRLPVAAHDAVSRELKLLLDRREDLVAQHFDDLSAAGARP